MRPGRKGLKLFLPFGGPRAATVRTERVLFLMFLVGRVHRVRNLAKKAAQRESRHFQGAPRRLD